MPGGFEENHENLSIASVPTEIWMEHLPNVNLHCYCYDISLHLCFLEWHIRQQQVWSQWIHCFTSKFTGPNIAHFICVRVCKKHCVLRDTQTLMA
jgi:hypothetical protein